MLRLSLYTFLETAFYSSEITEAIVLMQKLPELVNLKFVAFLSDITYHFLHRRHILIHLQHMAKTPLSSIQDLYTTAATAIVAAIQRA